MKRLIKRYIIKAQMDKEFDDVNEGRLYIYIYIFWFALNQIILYYDAIG